MTRPRVRVLAAGILALVGAALGCVMALAAGLGSVIGFTALASSAAAIAGALLGPSIVARRPFAGLAVALATYAVGVLLFPLFSIAAGVGAPGLAGSIQSTDNLLAVYFFAPVGFLLAVPFLPAVVATGIIGSRLARSSVPPADGPPTEPDLAADRRFRRRLVWAGVGYGVVIGLAFVLLTSMVSAPR